MPPDRPHRVRGQIAQRRHRLGQTRGTGGKAIARQRSPIHLQPIRGQIQRQGHLLHRQIWQRFRIAPAQPRPQGPHIHKACANALPAQLGDRPLIVRLAGQTQVHRLGAVDRLPQHLGIVGKQDKAIAHQRRGHRHRRGRSLPPRGPQRRQQIHVFAIDQPRSLVLLEVQIHARQGLLLPKQLQKVAGQNRIAGGGGQQITRLGPIARIAIKIQIRDRPGHFVAQPRAHIAIIVNPRFGQPAIARFLPFLMGLSPPTGSRQHLAQHFQAIRIHQQRQGDRGAFGNQHRSGGVSRRASSQQGQRTLGTNPHRTGHPCTQQDGGDRG